jgi:transcriptional regulator with XRE-family HTH domain
MQLFLCMKIGNTGLTAKQIAARIQHQRESDNKSQEQLAKIAEADQSTVSRILQGKICRMTMPLVKLCKYANIDLANESPNPAYNKLLMDALKQVWDGTEADAKVIARILLDLQGLRK